MNNDWICVNCSKQMDAAEKKYFFQQFAMCSIQCAKNYCLSILNEKNLPKAVPNIKIK